MQLASVKSSCLFYILLLLYCFILSVQCDDIKQSELCRRHSCPLSFVGNDDIVSDSILPWCSYGWVACCSCGILHSESGGCFWLFCLLLGTFSLTGLCYIHWYNTMCPLLLWLVMLYLFDVPGGLVFCEGMLGVGGDWGRGCGRRERNNSNHNTIYERMNRNKCSHKCGFKISPI